MANVLKFFKENHRRVTKSETENCENCKNSDNPFYEGSMLIDDTTFCGLALDSDKDRDKDFFNDNSMGPERQMQLTLNMYERTRCKYKHVCDKFMAREH